MPILRLLLSLFLLCPLFVFGSVQGLPSEKLSRYHELLSKRPGSEVIFTRFYNEWLGTASIEELGNFLSKRAESGTAADWEILAVFYLHRGEEANALRAFDSATQLK
ncbi:MAG: hypothetical protein ACPGSB_11785, partial [Opitutales bacterium]